MPNLLSGLSVHIGYDWHSLSLLLSIYIRLSRHLANVLALWAKNSVKAELRILRLVLLLLRLLLLLVINLNISPSSRWPKSPGWWPCRLLCLLVNYVPCVFTKNSSRSASPSFFFCFLLLIASTETLRCFQLRWIFGVRLESPHPLPRVSRPDVCIAIQVARLGRFVSKV